jgi:hypothetical protein
MTGRLGVDYKEQIIFSPRRHEDAKKNTFILAPSFRDDPMERLALQGMGCRFTSLIKYRRLPQ